MSWWANNSSLIASNGSLPLFARSGTEVSIFVIIYILLSATVVVGNILVVASYATNAKLRTGISMFFVSLAVSDLCVGLISIPWWIYQLLCSPTIKNCSSKDTNLIILNRIFDIFSALASIMNLVAISIERRIVVSNLKKISKRGRNKKVNLFMISVAWLLAMSISIYNGIYSSLAYSRIRTLVLFLCGFVVPLVIMVFIYIDIYRLVRKTQEKISRHISLHQRRVRVNTFEERKTAQTVIIITALFVLAWTPFFVVSVLYPYSPSSLPSGEKLKSLIDFIKWMHYSNSAVNPFVYAFRNEEIRKAMLRVIPNCFYYLCCKAGSAQERRLRRY
ncbi:D(1A) dopamine receptor-like [Actinia tenebrosa]|uniref:D(1A) dopamine receptor-like n=1 Tax=Actinia tenebrosa TaxID=6105 RepID=A0A6P8I9V4_ACTTE|nr:D(1A) dopamine receptor-like [Actinia tenebrosa]XP_031564814.1 D(1A) dopamine receptor-like [Actinia tenebrosa]